MRTSLFPSRSSMRCSHWTARHAIRTPHALAHSGAFQVEHARHGSGYLPLSLHPFGFGHIITVCPIFYIPCVQQTTRVDDRKTDFTHPQCATSLAASAIATLALDSGPNTARTEQQCKQAPPFVNRASRGLRKLDFGFHVQASTI